MLYQSSIPLPLLILSSGSQSVVLRPAAAVPGDLLAMQIPGPLSRFAKLKTLGEGHSNLFLKAGV